MGTTVTALLRSGNRLALAHIGDSRAYLLRDGVLTQITKDHTFVQTLVDEGRLTPEEAEQHPQRSVLMRVLSDIVDDPEPDFSMRESRVGDRYLLCSDGLSGVVSFETLRDTLADGDPPGRHLRAARRRWRSAPAHRTTSRASSPTSSTSPRPRTPRPPSWAPRRCGRSDAPRRTGRRPRSGRRP